MAQGVKFKPKRSDISDVFSQKLGKVSAIAEHYNVTRETIYLYLKDNPDMQELLETIRSQNEEMDLDNAEAIVRATMVVKENPKLRFEAAKYVLDNKGKRRNWGQTKNEADVRGLVQDKISNEINIIYEEHIKGKK